MNKCFLCKSKQQDEVKYGEFMTRDGISVHYFCLLLTSNLMQRGRDNEGFLGFLINDIQEEANRVGPAVCCYCKKANANISCCASKCRKTFHLVCGIENEAENQFVGTFKSYCNRHVTGKKCRQPTEADTCCICYESILGEHGRFSCVTMLRAPCCKNGWFHKWCLASFAKTAGYFFKCPLCNDNKVFRKRLVYKGIFIPDRDAAWELEPNAFAELLERPNVCAAIDCIAKGGRSSQSHRNKLVYCGTCGSIAIHRKCMTTPVSDFFCDECTKIISTVNTSSLVNISVSQQTNSDEDEDVDICGNDTDDDDDNESNDGMSLTKFQLEYTEVDDEIIKPSRKVKRNGFRIFDDDLDDEECIDSVDDIVLPKRGSKRSSRLLSSDSEKSIAPAKRQRKNSATDSLFDSGTETDPPRSIVVNSSIDAHPLSDLDSSKKCDSNKNELEIHHTESVRSKKLDLLDEKKRSGKRFISLNDTPNENWCIAKRTRRQSMGAEINWEGHKIIEWPSTPSSVWTANNTSKAVNFEKTITTASTQQINGPTQMEFQTALIETNSVKKNNGGLRKRCLSFNATSEAVISMRGRSRSRTMSEDPANTIPALERVRRRSFLQSPYSTSPSQRFTSKGSNNSKNLTYNNLSRRCLIPENEAIQQKRPKNNIASNENENGKFVLGTTFGKKSPGRSRSPLTSNLCALYAFITPSYIKNKEPQKRVTDTHSGETVPLQTEIKTIPETVTFFAKKSLNIQQTENVEIPTTVSNTECNNSASTTNIKPIRAQDIFFQSYNILINTPARSKSFKPRKRSSHSFVKHPLPSNQTKIESFFKRI